MRVPALFLLVACAAAATAGCRGGGRPPSGLTTQSLSHGGVTRTFHVHLPPAHRKDQPAPLVIALHGGGGAGVRFDASTNGQTFREADRRGWVIAYPEGIAKGWNDGRPLTEERDRQRAGIDDVAFIAALIDRMRADYGIDPKRVYATGISNGGFMSLRLAVELADRVAAVAPVTASLSKALAAGKPSRAVPILVMNGTADPLVPYEGGHVQVLGRSRGKVLATAATVSWWVAHDGCTEAPSRETLADRATDDGTRVQVERYQHCRDGSEVLLYRIEGGGHTWPGGMQYLPVDAIGPVCRDIDAASEIFDFFARHHLP